MKHNYFTPGKIISNIRLFFLIAFILTGLHRTFAQNWSPLSYGMTDWVFATTVYEGHLIAGGQFIAAGGVNANRIAAWDGNSWSPLGDGFNGKVNALTVYNGNLVAAGEFTMAGTLEVNFIAMWDGTAWVDDLGGVGSIVTSLAVMNGTLYAGGYFVEADNTPVNYIAKRVSGGWAALAGGMGGSQGQVMALAVHNNELYAGGFFTSAGGAPANHIAKWNGTSWSPLGSGISNIVYSLCEYDGNLVAGGLFLSAGGVPANHIAKWNGSSWSTFGSGMSGTFYQYVLSLAVYNNELIAGGYFTHAGGNLVNGIAKWNGSSWSDLNGGFFYGGSNVFGANTLCVYGNELIAGGLFTSAGSTGAAHIASWYAPPAANNGVVLTAFLEGPYTGSSMTTTLNSSGYIPLSQPYNQAPWNYSGTESVVSLPGSNIVDWVLVELRDAMTPASATSATTIVKQAAFLRNDGHVVDLDGTDFLPFTSGVNNNLYAVIWHRNHLGIMSGNALTLNGNNYVYNFSSGASQVYPGSSGHKQIAAGVWGMVAGDGNADKQVNNADKITVWIPQSGSSGYRSADFNMNGQVDNADKIGKWKPNVGYGGQVPDNLTPPGGYQSIIPN